MAVDNQEPGNDTPPADHDVDRAPERSAAEGSVERRNTRAYSQIVARVVDQPLLFSRAKLDVLLNALGPRLLGLSGSAPPTELLAGAPSFDAPAVKGNVAVIPVCGTLVHTAFAAMDPPSGLTSYATLRRSFDAALEDSAIAAIVFDIDSHGGEVAGCMDLVDHIHASRGRKPIYALVDEMAVSAAYAIASAADRVYVPKSGHVGSIGVCAVHVDQSKANEQAGLKVTTLYVGDRKNDLNPNEPLSDAARGVLMGELNAAYDRFVEAVTRNRGISAKDVRTTDAGIFSGASAVELGLADFVMPVAKALTGIVADAARTPARPAARGGAEIIQLEAARREHFDRGQREAVAAERRRVTDIEAIPVTLRRPELGGIAMKLAAAGLGVEHARSILFEVISAGSSHEIVSILPKRTDASASEPNPLSPLAIAERRRRDVESRTKGE